MTMLQVSGEKGQWERLSDTRARAWDCGHCTALTGLPRSLDTNKQVAHVKFANTHISEPEPANLHGPSYGCILPRGPSYGCILPRAPTTGGLYLVLST